MGCGSYATMPYFRLPVGEPCAGKWIGERSHCTSCGHKLRTRDLFPVFNWIWTRGKCAFCGTQISPVYFFIEFFCVVISVAAFLRFGFENMQFYITTLGLGVCLVILTATDFTYKKLPGQVLVVSIMFGLVNRTLINGQIYDMVFSFMIGTLILLAAAELYKKFSGKEPSWKHLQLTATAGIWLPLPQLFIFFITAGIIALLIKRTSLPQAAAITIPLIIFVLNL